MLLLSVMAAWVNAHSATFVGISRFNIISNKASSAAKQAQQPIVLQFETDLPLSYSLSVPNTHTVVLQLHEARFMDGVFSNGQLPVTQLPSGLTRVTWVPPKQPGQHHGQLMLVGPKLAQRRLLVQGATPMEWPTTPNNPEQSSATEIAASAQPSGFSLGESPVIKAANVISTTYTATSQPEQSTPPLGANIRYPARLVTEPTQEPIAAAATSLITAPEPSGWIEASAEGTPSRPNSIRDVLQSLTASTVSTTSSSSSPSTFYTHPEPSTKPTAEPLRPLLPAPPSIESLLAHPPTSRKATSASPAEYSSLTYTIKGSDGSYSPAQSIVLGGSPSATAAHRPSVNITPVLQAFEAQDWPLTHQRLLKLLKSSPRQASLWALLGELYLATQQPIDATTAFESALALEPSITTQGVYVDRWAVSLYQWPDVLAAWEHWQHIAPNWASIIQPHYLANTVGGTLATAAGQTDIAATYWSRAVDLEPASIEARIQLALLLELQQQPEAAFAQYKAASRLNPLDETTRQGIARLQSVAATTTTPTLVGVVEPTVVESTKKPVASKKRHRVPSALPLRFHRPPAFDSGGFRPF